jgi:hypothetical protein
MEIEKFKLVLALSRPDYELECFHADDGPCARIKLKEEIGRLTPKELLDGHHYKYFSFGKTLDDATRKVMIQWNSRYHGESK